tara:strand:- start:139 stop:498 length:360 start_codon:yes stop_codon:yes gene_type:complete
MNNHESLLKMIDIRSSNFRIGLILLNFMQLGLLALNVFLNTTGLETPLTIFFVAFFLGSTLYTERQLNGLGECADDIDNEMSKQMHLKGYKDTPFAFLRGFVVLISIAYLAAQLIILNS